MNRTVALLATALVVWLVPLPRASAQHDSYRPEVGRPHPEIVLPRIDDGESVSLSGFRGKKVLLIHFASW